MDELRRMEMLQTFSECATNGPNPRVALDERSRPELLRVEPQVETLDILHDKERTRFLHAVVDERHQAWVIEPREHRYLAFESANERRMRRGEPLHRNGFPTGGAA